MSECIDLSYTKWYFNSTLTEPLQDLKSNPPQINFFVPSSATAGGSAVITGGTWGGLFTEFTFWHARPNSVYSVDYTNSSGSLWAWDTRDGWFTETLRTIVIIGGTHTSYQPLLNWMNNNATQLPLEPDLEIKYKGQTIFDKDTAPDFFSGITLTLPVNNKFILTDIDIYSKDLRLKTTYNNTDIIDTVWSGTLKLKTAGKKGNSNITLQVWDYDDPDAPPPS